MQPPRIVLAVTGSIAAYKAAALASTLMKEGAEVRVILTPGASRFVGALTFEALTGHPVASDVWDETTGNSRMGHLELARWADVLAVAPATADTIARLALGLAGDLLGATALACRAPLVLAPAMETEMFGHPATQDHLDVLRARGALVVGPAEGRLASGTSGLGRMVEPDVVAASILDAARPRQDLAGRRILVTAGPTQEPIDRVRYIGNRSSGKMGYAIAGAAAARGAAVVLVSGPTALTPPAGVALVGVETAGQMERAVLEHASNTDVFVMAAAVADFRPRTAVDGKLRRSAGLTLDLEPTPDIAAAARSARPDAVHVGFALEAEDLVASARAKLRRKGQALVVGNRIAPDHNPFGADTNTVVLVSEDTEIELPSMSKRVVAERICDEIVALLNAATRR